MGHSPQGTFMNEIKEPSWWGSSRQGFLLRKIREEGGLGRLYRDGAQKKRSMFKKSWVTSKGTIVMFQSLQ